LVYIFVGIVCFAFAAMCYITYTERDLAQFLKNKTIKQEVVIVDPLFTSLKESLVSELDKEKPLEANINKFYPKLFFDHFLSENRPLTIRGYASNWRATKYWGDKSYLAEQAANMVHLKTFGFKYALTGVNSNKTSDSDVESDATNKDGQDD